MSLAYSIELAEEMLYVVLGIAVLFVLFFAPYQIGRVIIQWTQAHLPTWARFVVLVVFFAILLLWASLISGAAFTELYEQGIKWAVFFSIAMLVFSLLCFASLSSVLSDLGYVQFEPQVPHGEFWRLQDFYLWHFLNSVPGLKIPDTLRWEEPFKYKDHLSGVVLLAFKLIVILPVIGSFTAWYRAQ